MQTPKSISDSQIAQFSDRQLSSDWIRKRFRWTKTTADRLRYMERISQCIVWFLYQHSNVYYLLWNFVKYTHKRWYSHLETTKWIFNNSPFILIWVGLNVDEMFTLIKPPFSITTHFQTEHTHSVYTNAKTDWEKSSQHKQRLWHLQLKQNKLETCEMNELWVRKPYKFIRTDKTWF